jgi:NAD-dependent deacetylase
MGKPIIAVLTGAGISAESGIKTFRDADGLWEGYDVQDVASIDGWYRDQELVLDFYNQRRRQLLEVEPNTAHKALVDLEESFDVHVITQNVDDLHERAGSSKVVHLHGELLKVRSIKDEELVYEWKKDLITGDLCERGHQLRPHIVWFGEMVPMLEVAATIVSQAEVVLIIGTSMQVYPAASLVSYAPHFTPIHYVDPRPSVNYELSARSSLNIIDKNASSGVPEVVEKLLGG